MSDPTEQRILQNLQSLIGGIAPDGAGSNGRGHVSMSDRIIAGEKYQKILATRREREATAAGAQRAVLEADRQHALDANQQAHAQQIEEKKLLLEAERIEVQKAEVIVRALEVAARNPELAALTAVVGEMSQRLLGGATLPALEDKEHQG